MARSVNEVDLHSLVGDRRVLGQDGDTAFAFQGERIHHPVNHLLVGAEDAALAEQSIDERGLAVVNMSNDGDVTDIVAPGRAVLQNSPPRRERKRAEVLGPLQGRLRNVVHCALSVRRSQQGRPADHPYGLQICLF